MKILTYILSIFVLLFWSDLTAQTPDFIEQQGYLYDASYMTGTSDIGIGAQNVWFLPGGKGENVSIVDVEQGWNLEHEDLQPPEGIQLIHGTMNSNETDHGTAEEIPPQKVRNINIHSGSGKPQRDWQLIIIELS